MKVTKSSSSCKPLIRGIFFLSIIFNIFYTFSFFYFSNLLFFLTLLLGIHVYWNYNDNDKIKLFIVILYFIYNIKIRINKILLKTFMKKEKNDCFFFFTIYYISCKIGIIFFLKWLINYLQM